MIGLQDTELVIEQVVGVDLRNIPTYSLPIKVLGHLQKKTEVKYEDKEVKVINYIFITLNKPGIVKNGDKINGFTVKSVKEVSIHGMYLITEVIAI